MPDVTALWAMRRAVRLRIGEDRMPQRMEALACRARTRKGITHGILVDVPGMAKELIQEDIMNVHQLRMGEHHRNTFLETASFREQRKERLANGQFLVDA